MRSLVTSLILNKLFSLGLLVHMASLEKLQIASGTGKDTTSSTLINLLTKRHAKAAATLSVSCKVPSAILERADKLWQHKHPGDFFGEDLQVLLIALVSPKYYFWCKQFFFRNVVVELLRYPIDLILWRIHERYGF